MAVRKLVYYPGDEARLRALSKPVPHVKNKKLRQLIQDLKDTLESQPGAAIAAPQIGALKRVTVVKFGQNEDEDEQPMLALINPQILEAGADEPGFDGCLSIPNIYSWDTPRPIWIEFKALGEDGRVIRRRVEGMDARMLHHEIDHLDGILFIDRLRDSEELYTPVQGANGKTKMVRLKDLPHLTKENR
ncbi:MAG: peptide deformylase [Chloroflexi bacterium]|nr:peptide deformylase [Chloroflexota bacterium]